MNKKVKKNWLKELRSGKYIQGRFKLLIGNRYCCLGVLCETEKLPKEPMLNQSFIFKSKKSKTFNDTKLPKSFRKQIGITSVQENKLISMNDSHQSFKQIANWISKNL